MKRLCLVIAFLILLPLTSIAQGKQPLGGVAATAPITYLLNCFPGTTADQSYTNGQVIDTAGEGCTSGSLTVSGTLCVASSGELQSSSGYCTSLTSPAISTLSGLACFYKFTLRGADINNFLGWTDKLELEFYSDGLAYRQPGNRGIFNITNSVTYSNANVLGGFNSSGVPCVSPRATCNVGGSYFVKGGIYSNWTLLWVNTDISSSQVTFHDTNAHLTNGSYNLLIPDYDFSTVLQPSFLDTFASSFGTPDVGGAWTQQSGVWSVSSGKALSTTAGIATFAGPSNYVLYDTKVTMPASGTTGSGLIVRWVDSTHYWYVQLVAGTTDNVKLIEVNGSEPGDTRSTASATLSASTEYRIRVIAKADSPYWKTYVNEVEKNSYTTVGSSSTATAYGLKDEGNSNASFDVVAIWPRTSTTYDTEFAKVGY